MIEIRQYDEKYQDEIVALILYCQNDGSRPYVTADNQPEILHIRRSYMINGGNFWVAIEDDRVAGCIGLMNYGNGNGILKKFFVKEAYRGAPNHLGRKLYNVLLEFAKSHNITRLILDTPKNTERAHNFYEKAGFHKIGPEQLPFVYDCPYEDCDFFMLDDIN